MSNMEIKSLDLKLEKGKAVCFDFDGVIHKYSKGWQDGSIYDKPNEEMLELIILLQRIGIPVFICSTRNPIQIIEWWDKNIIFPKRTLIGDGEKFWRNTDFVGITDKKLPAQLYIDDRAYKYTGQTVKQFILDNSIEIKEKNNE